MPPSAVTERGEDGSGSEIRHHALVAIVDDFRADDLTREHGADYRGAGVLRGLVDDFDDGSWTQFKQDTAIVEATIPGSDSSCTHRAHPEVDFGVVCSRVQNNSDGQIERHLTPPAEDRQLASAVVRGPRVTTWQQQPALRR
jgi:hypothetical protein